MIPVESIILLASVLLIVSIIASKASGRLGVPALLLFLVIGMLAGSEGPGGIEFDDHELAQLLGMVALTLILFSGGLDTRWSSVRKALWRGVALSTLGVFLTALMLGWFVRATLGFGWTEALLLGAIVSSTDAAAVFAVLRSRNVSLRDDLRSLLELESGSNDPMAVFLTVGLISLLVNPAASMASMIPLFIQQMVLGAVIGYLLGRGMTYVMNRLRLEYEGLYPVLSLSMVLFTYSAATFLGGNGFLATYLAGIIMSNSEFIHKRSLMRFHDGLAWLMQIVMFLTLGLLVFPSHIIPVITIGLLTALFLMFVARPIGVFVTLLPAKMRATEKTMVAWVGLRGAVPIVLATFPLVAGIPRADMIFNVVFFIVLTSALLQGTSVPMVARWLKVDAPAPPPAGLMPSLRPEEPMKDKLTEIEVPPGATAVGKQIVDLGMPQEIALVLMRRDSELMTPTGSTILRPGDVLLVCAEDDYLGQAYSVLQSRRNT